MPALVLIAKRADRLPTPMSLLYRSTWCVEPFVTRRRTPIAFAGTSFIALSTPPQDARCWPFRMLATSPRDAIQRKRMVVATTGAIRTRRWIGARATPSFSRARCLVQGRHQAGAAALRREETEDRGRHRPRHRAARKEVGVPAKRPDEPGLRENPSFVDFALSDGLSSLVTNYLGTILHLNRVDLLYSASHGGEEAISSQIYHRSRGPATSEAVLESARHRTKGRSPSSPPRRVSRSSKRSSRRAPPTARMPR